MVGAVESAIGLPVVLFGPEDLMTTYLVLSTGLQATWFSHLQETIAARPRAI